MRSGQHPIEYSKINTDIVPLFHPPTMLQANIPLNKGISLDAQNRQGRCSSGQKNPLFFHFAQQPK
jgi:hypothetical protein